jgi:hypothetical protein
VSEKEHWTIQLPGQLPGVPDVFGPADLVKALFSGCRLEFVNALFDRGEIIGQSATAAPKEERNQPAQCQTI